MFASFYPALNVCQLRFSGPHQGLQLFSIPEITMPPNQGSPGFGQLVLTTSLRASEPGKYC